MDVSLEAPEGLGCVLIAAGLPPDSRLRFGGKLLAAGRALRSFGVGALSTLRLCSGALHGGMEAGAGPSWRPHPKFWAETDYSPLRAAQLRCLSKQRTLSAEEKQEFGDAQLGPRCEAAPVKRRGPMHTAEYWKKEMPVPEGEELPQSAASSVKAGEAERGAGAGAEPSAQSPCRSRANYTWVARHPLPPQTSFRQFVDGVFEGQACQIGAETVCAWERAPALHCYVYCKQHVAPDGKARCGHSAKFVRHGDFIEELTADGVPCADWAGELSREAKHKKSQGVAEEMAKSPDSVSSQRRERIDKGMPVASPGAIYRKRTESRQGVRAGGGSTPDEFHTAMGEYPRADTAAPRQFYLDDANSVLESFVAVIMCAALLEEGRRFMSRANGTLRLCMDATHNIGLQKWKLFCVGFLGVWWQDGCWRVTLLPLAFAIAPTECTEAAAAVLKAVLAKLPELRDRTCAIYLDGGPALLAAALEVLPWAVVKRCLQHIKKDLVAPMKKRMWAGANHSSTVKEWAERSAFLPPGFFDVFWRACLALLRERMGGALYANYLEETQLREEEGILTAQWQSHPGAVDAPFSTYSNNALEALWKVIDLAIKDLPPRVDILSELKFHEAVVGAWLHDARFSQVKAELRCGRGPSKAPPSLVKGNGALCETGGMREGKQDRRLVARRLIELFQDDSVDGPFFISGEADGGLYWACPKYDPAEYNEPVLHAFARSAMARRPSDPDLQLLGIMSDGAEKAVDPLEVLKVCGKFTLLQERDGRIVESHKDFCKNGQTEHSLCIEDIREYGNHKRLPLGKAKAKRRCKPRLQASSAAKMKAKAKFTGRGRGRPRKQAAEGQAPAGQIPAGGSPSASASRGGAAASAEPAAAAPAESATEVDGTGGASRQKEDRDLTLANIFRLLNKSSGSCLTAGDFRPYGDLQDFGGSDEEWAVEFAEVVKTCGEPGDTGLTKKAFAEYVVNLSNYELEEFLGVLRGDASPSTESGDDAARSSLAPAPAQAGSAGSAAPAQAAGQKEEGGEANRGMKRPPVAGAQGEDKPPKRARLEFARRLWDGRYFERQTRALCGQHALNNLVGGPTYQHENLHAIAREIAVEIGDPQGVAGHSAGATGWFSHGVLGRALDSTSPAVYRLLAEYLGEPESAWFELLGNQAVYGALVHLERTAHWACLVKVRKDRRRCG